jgi:hypothetical protein
MQLGMKVIFGLQKKKCVCVYVLLQVQANFFSPLMSLIQFIETSHFIYKNSGWNFKHFNY